MRKGSGNKRNKLLVNENLNDPLFVQVQSYCVTLLQKYTIIQKIETVPKLIDRRRTNGYRRNVSDMGSMDLFDQMQYCVLQCRSNLFFFLSFLLSSFSEIKRNTFFFAFVVRYSIEKLGGLSENEKEVKLSDAQEKNVHE